MNTYPHEWRRLAHRGLRGIERYDRRERRFQIAMCILLTMALIGVYCLCGGI